MPSNMPPPRSYKVLDQSCVHTFNQQGTVGASVDKKKLGELGDY